MSSGSRMKNNFLFTYEKLEEQYKKSLDLGYETMTCLDFFKNKSNLGSRVIVNRVDVDLSLNKALALAEIFERLNLKATFFVRLHAPEYNPLSFENYRIIKGLHEQGFEIGYHSEIIDLQTIWNEDAEVCLKRDLKFFENYFGIKIEGVASHGGMTGLNNLDFWNDKKPESYGLSYEGYDQEPSFNLFNNSLYISDSEWTQWKSYSDGKLNLDDKRSLGEHLDDNPRLIYLTIHTDTYFHNHFYEKEL